jgi:hypothetical protein
VQAVHESRLKADSSASPKGFHELPAPVPQAQVSKGFSPANSENVKALLKNQKMIDAIGFSMYKYQSLQCSARR